MFGIPLTDRYDDIKSIGGDYFIAENTSIPMGIFWVRRRNMKISRQIGSF
ncbi:MAG: hypothetical protein ACLUD9_00575 [Anaerotignum faecicola]